MPAKSDAQRRLMFAALKSADVRDRHGISKKVAKDFTDAETSGRQRQPPRKKKKPSKGTTARRRPPPRKKKSPGTKKRR